LAQQLLDFVFQNLFPVYVGGPCSFIFSIKHPISVKASNISRGCLTTVYDKKYSTGEHSACSVLRKGLNLTSHSSQSPVNFKICQVLTVII